MTDELHAQIMQLKVENEALKREAYYLRINMQDTDCLLQDREQQLAQARREGWDAARETDPNVNDMLYQYLTFEDWQKAEGGRVREFVEVKSGKMGVIEGEDK